MENIGLFLDSIKTPIDIPKSIDKWEIVKNYKEFSEFIENYYNTYNKLPKLISLEHDLHTEHFVKESKRIIGRPIMYSQYIEKTGKDCIEWLCEFSYNKKVPINGTINLHSENVMGKTNMRWYLEKYIKQEKYKGIVIELKWKYV